MKLSPAMKRGLWAAGIFCGALCAGLIVSFMLERHQHAGKAVRGVTCRGVALAGLSRPQIERELSSVAQATSSRSIIIQLGEHKRTVSAGKLGLVFDKANVERALKLGRKSWIGGEFGFWLARLVSRYEFTPRVEVNQAQLKTELEPWANTFLSEPILPSISYDKKLVFVLGKAGEVIDYNQAANNLEKWAHDALKSETVELPATLEIHSVLLEPKIPAAIFEERKLQAQRLLSQAIVAESSDGAEQVTLRPELLGQALMSETDPARGELLLDLTMSTLRPKMAEFLGKVERPAKDADISFDRLNKLTISESEAGLVLDEPAFLAAVWEASASEKRRVVVPLTEVQPKLTTEDAEGLNLVGLVSQFMTRHDCCQPRVHNIHLAASMLNGTILRPGEKFSLNGLLGPRSQASGYKSAPAIVRGEMEDVFGGGISQLATTLFNAALRGGYKMIQRQPHSVYFSRYPEGHEATVSFPEPDLIFENDTNAGLLIKTEYSGTFIKVLIYGDNAGRVVTLDKSARYNIVNPPVEYEPEEQMDPEKPERVRAGQMGWTVVVSRKIQNADGSIAQERREVVYKPRAELLRIHPCMIPEGEKGHTGDACPEPEELERDEREEELSSDVYYETKVEYDEEGS